MELTATDSMSPAV